KPWTSTMVFIGTLLEKVDPQGDNRAAGPWSRPLNTLVEPWQGDPGIKSSPRNNDAYLKGALPVAARDRVSLLDQRRGHGELSSMNLHAGAVFKVQRKEGERSGQTRLGPRNRHVPAWRRGNPQ